MTTATHKRILKALGGALAIAAVAVALLCGLSKVFYPKDNRASAGMNHEAANGILGERENTIDVLFLGDSEAYSSFSPLRMWEHHGFTSYVCATDIQQLTYSNTLLHRATKNQRPRVVIIEAHSAYNPFSPGDIIFRALQDIFPVFEFHDRWKNLTPHDFTDQPRTTFTHVAKGFHTHGGVMGADATGHMAPSTNVEPIPRTSKIYLRRMVSHCRSMGATPLLVSAPSTLCWNTERHNGMEAFARELDVPYLDLNEKIAEIGIDWVSDTYDGGDHLNYYGARKVSDFMGSHLAKTYGLPDHRDDDAYASWHESVEQFARQSKVWRGTGQHSKGPGGSPHGPQTTETEQNATA